MASTKKPAAGTRAKGSRAKPPTVDLHELGARVVSVFGPFAERTLIEMPAKVAAEMFPEPLARSGRTSVVEAVTRDLEAIRRDNPDVADSGLAASALALAYEMDHPYNSATSKSMCAKSLADALTRLHEWAPAAEKKDGLDELRARRAARRAGGAAT